jgi:hypothetical protein
MSNPKHTPEPWEYDGRSHSLTTVHCIMAGPRQIGHAHDFLTVDDGNQAKANAARIVACVNACAGLNPEAVADVVKLAEEAMTDSATIDGEHGGPGCFYCGTEEGHKDDCRASRILSRLRGEGGASDDFMHADGCAAKIEGGACSCVVFPSGEGGA